MNIKKMFTTLSAMVVAVMFTLPNASVFAATYSQELTDAYNWAYSKGVTTMSPIDNANMYGAITRSEMAKMLSVYATEVLGMTPDTSAACTFSDIDSVKGDLHDYIIESCQLGIMGQGITPSDHTILYLELNLVQLYQEFYGVVNTKEELLTMQNT